VIVLDRDVLKDYLPLRYDPEQVTPERILEVVREEGKKVREQGKVVLEQGFEVTIVPKPDN
jgi:hypothetical protein